MSGMMQTHMHNILESGFSEQPETAKNFTLLKVQQTFMNTRR